ncbi:MAG: anaerobic ribonucleoside-triphosphate reductase activating protein [Patescibacteria group bacterium]
MIIGGLQPVTLLDYPQKVAAIIFTSGCNMRCSFCHNPELVLPELAKADSRRSVKKTINFLSDRKKYLDGVVITGGEPLMQRGLFGFCRRLKKDGYEIKIDTNGLLPAVLKKLIDKKLVNYLAMDIKGPLDDYERFCGVKVDSTKLAASIKIIKTSGLPYEFRSTLVKGLHRVSDFKKMLKTIKGAEKYYLQNFIFRDKLVGSDFKGKSFSPKELNNFLRLAGQQVKSCYLRSN